MIADNAFRARAQEAAESRMRDHCTTTRLATEIGSLDPDTWLPTQGAGVTVYAGQCRLRMAGNVSGSTARDVGPDSVSTSTPTLSLPIGAAKHLVGDLVVIDDVPADDPGGSLRLNLRLRVVGLILGTDMTAQRVSVEAVTG